MRSLSAMIFASASLLPCRTAAYFAWKLEVVREFLKAPERFRIVKEGRPDRFDQKLREAGVGFEKPAPESDAVRLVDDPIGIEAVQIVEHRLFHEIGVKLRHAVDLVRAEEGEVPHAHAPPGIFVYERDVGQKVLIVATLFAQCVQVQGIDQIDDLHVAREQALHQRHRPGFKRLGQQRVVRIGERGLGDGPGLLPADAVNIDEQPHQLGDRDRRVRIVELDRHLVGKLRDIAVLFQVTVDEVLQRGGREEIFLAQPKFLASRGRVAWIEHLGDRFGPDLFGLRGDVITRVKDIEAQRIGRA